MTYFVDATGGNDSNTGLSQALPWQTITKVNAATFLPDDQMLFKCGEAWLTTRLTIPSSGTSGHPIVFGAYGTGVTPIIQSGAAENTATIDCNGQSYITIQDLHIKTPPTLTDDLYGIKTTGHHLSFINLEIEGGDFGSGAKNQAIGIGCHDSATNCHDITVSGCTVHHCSCFVAGGAGIYFGANATPGPQHIVIEYSTSRNNGHGDAGGLDHGIYVKNSDDVIIRRNLIYSNDSHGIQIHDSVTNLIIDSNEIYLNGMYGIYVENNTNGNVGLLIENNLIYSNIETGLWAQDSESLRIYHNTLVNNPSGASWGMDMNIQPGCDNSIIKNNILYQNQAVNVHNAIRVDSDAVVATLTINNNDYYTSSYAGQFNINGTEHTLTQWRAHGCDANGIEANPVFVTNFTNLHLQVTSPCIAAGDAAVGVLTDYDGVVRGAAVDIGAYEYV
jgi:parallel beta-helix repeat protein